MKSNYKKSSNSRPYVCAKRRKFSKKGLSTIIVTILLIGLTVVAVGVVWAAVNSMIKPKLANSQACFGNFGKVSINPQYTCYKQATNEFQFSLSIADINVDKILVGISSSGQSKTYTIPGTYTDLKNYTSGTYNTQIILPGKNGGTTYITNFFTAKPDSVKIIPIISGQQCDVSDTLYEIDNCIG